MHKSFNLYRDIIISILIITGILAFMSGDFIFSTALFGASSLISNINFDAESLDVLVFRGTS